MGQTSFSQRIKSVHFFKHKDKNLVLASGNGFWIDIFDPLSLEKSEFVNKDIYDSFGHFSRHSLYLSNPVKSVRLKEISSFQIYNKSLFAYSL